MSQHILRDCSVRKDDQKAKNGCIINRGVLFF